MNITYKSPAVKIVCLLPSRFMCRNVSLGLFVYKTEYRSAMEWKFVIGRGAGYERVIRVTYEQRLIFIAVIAEVKIY